VPVLFAYVGWKTASFMTGEMRNPKRDLARALLIGVISVTAIYLSVNIVCLHTLGPLGLAATTTPAFTVMRQAIGAKGALFMAVAIAVSTLGFLSQGMLTAPRVFFAMARDGLFFRAVAWLPKRTRVPVAAIVLQGVLASIVALSGGYEQILNYVVSVDFIFFGLTGATLFVFRRKMKASEAQRARLRAAIQDTDSPELRGERLTPRPFCARPREPHRTPGHPFTTIFFIAACWLVVLATFYNFPKNSFVGLAILMLGIPVYFYWSKKRRSVAGTAG